LIGGHISPIIVSSKNKGIRVIGNWTQISPFIIFLLTLN